MLGQGMIGLLAAVGLQLAIGAADASGQGPAAGEDKAPVDKAIVALSAHGRLLRVGLGVKLVRAGPERLRKAALRQSTEAGRAGRGSREKNRRNPQEFRRLSQLRADHGAALGKDLVLLRYLYKCDNFPVVWHIAYYRDQREPRLGEASNGESSRVISIRFDTDLEALVR